MNMTTKQDIFKEHKKAYWKANKQSKGEILDHITKTTTLCRESAVRWFKRLQKRGPERTETRGRKTYYTKDVDAALFDIWNASNQPCGELLYPLIKEYVAILQRDNDWKHGSEATGKLLAMKEHTVRRKASAFKKKHGAGVGKSTTKPSHLKSIIPIFKGPWNTVSVGTGQLDTVAHCGDTLLGDYVYTLNYTDAPTYWIIPRAQWNKGAQVTKDSMEYVYKHFPVNIVHIHPDTGSEFINHTLKPWCDENSIEMSRSEPGKKNDNMYVEERNGHVVRKYLGYTRFDCREVVNIINGMYDLLALYLNHFQAVRRTLSKERVGAKYKRTYEKVPKTPYQRMLEHSDILDTVKAQLRKGNK
jgi:hypothetical protein